MKNNRELERWGAIVSLVGDGSVAHLEIVHRRARLLAEIAQLIGSTKYYWAWGRGHPARDITTPLAIIDGGFSPEEKTVFIELAMSEETDRLFRQPIAARLDIQATHSRPQIIDDSTWFASEMFKRWYAPNGIGDWLTSIRYGKSDTWSQLMFLRPDALGPYPRHDLEFVDTLMANLSWLHADTSEAVPQEAFDGLTRRQRTILLLLLDGQSRKAIAERLCISENTVNDHAKAIYRHFGVKSISSLAAQMVRGSSAST